MGCCNLYDLEDVEMKYREPFTLFKRGKVWYYRVFNEQGIRKAYSTGVTTRAEAKSVVLAKYKAGSLIPAPTEKKKDLPLTFGEFAKDWWDWDACQYLKYEKARGRTYSQRYCFNQKSCVKNHLMPVFGKMRLEKITAVMVEEWLFSLTEVHHLAPKTANNIFNNLSVILGEACRKELIQRNPCQSVRLLRPNCRQRGVLLPAEVRRLFSSLEIWDNNIIGYAANLLASCTGMRSREVAALRGMNIKEDHLEIDASFDDRFGMKSTKTSDSRKLPIPEKVMGVLLSLKRGEDDFLFTLNGLKPVDEHYFLDALYNALEKIGINKEEREKRNIVFHSWRHFLNSQLLAHNISEAKTQKITGHKTKEMTMHYAHFNAKDLEDVLEVTSEILAD